MPKSRKKRCFHVTLGAWPDHVETSYEDLPLMPRDCLILSVVIYFYPELFIKNADEYKEYFLEKEFKKKNKGDVPQSATLWRSETNRNL